MNAKEKKAIFNNKKILRLLYREWYLKIRKNLKEGKILEIGSGFGLAKNYFDCITSEYKKNNYVDFEEDACNLSFEDAALDNIVGIDVLHHLYSSDKFFSESYRTLRPLGRIVLIEPYISPLSYVVRKLFHHEPLRFKNYNISKNPDDSNMALPTILIREGKINFNGRFNVVKIERIDCFAYLFSLGFRKTKIVPDFSAKALIKLDHLLLKNNFLTNFLAFKVLIALEKNEN